MFFLPSFFLVIRIIIYASSVYSYIYHLKPCNFIARYTVNLNKKFNPPLEKTPAINNWYSIMSSLIFDSAIFKIISDMFVIREIKCFLAVTLAVLYSGGSVSTQSQAKNIY